MRTQGKPLYGNEIRIVGDDGEVLPRDGTTPGHLQVRGAWIAAGYFRRPEVDAITQDGWLQTGDVATHRPRQYAASSLIARRRHQIRRRVDQQPGPGRTPPPSPGRAEAAVIAIPHPRWQERPLLIVVPIQPVTATEIRDHLAGVVPKWWLPDQIVFVEELPHGPTGKLAKRELRHWLSEGRLNIAQ